MNRIKRVFCMALALMVMIAMIPAGAFRVQAEDTSSVEAFRVTFAKGDHVTAVDVYKPGDYTTAAETGVEYTYTLDKDTGEYTNVKKQAQVNFKVTVEEGYAIDSVTVTDGTYKNIKTNSTDDPDIPADCYRVTQISADTTVTITAKAAASDDPGKKEESSDDAASYKATFEKDDNVESIDVYYTQNLTGEASEKAVTTALSRNSDTGAETKTDGQINFKVNCKAGYEIDTVTVTEGTYKNSKDLGYDFWRITKITGDMTVSITTKADDGQEDPAYTVTFAKDSGVKSIDVYYLQDYTMAKESDVSSTLTRNGDTGATTQDEGQVSFKVNCADGFAIDSVSVTADTYNKIKTNADDTTIPEGAYRVTKITKDTTVTIVTKSTSSDDGKKDDDAKTDDNTKTDDDTKTDDATTDETKTDTTTDETKTDGATTDDAKTDEGTSIEDTDAGSAAETIKANDQAAFAAFSLRMNGAEKKTISIRWNKIKNAKKYVIWAAAAGQKKLTKTAEVSGVSYTCRSLKKGTYYSILVTALNKKGKKIAVSKMVYAATTGGKYTNTKSVKVTNAKKITIKKGKKFTVKTKVEAWTSGKTKTYRALSYETSSKVVRVSKKGVIKAVKKGSCYVYIYDQNGVFKKIKVTVK